MKEMDTETKKKLFYISSECFVTPVKNLTVYSDLLELI